MFVCVCACVWGVYVYLLVLRCSKVYYDALQQQVSALLLSYMLGASLASCLMESID